MRRTIVSAERGKRSTFITLDCGHSRSIGGHVWANGKPVGDPDDLVRFRIAYDCQDGMCGSQSAKGGE
ncbi:hypothetical protein GG804_25970 [Sphingomonas histidinilytica]|uniref:hypothetical protein n=1 Tax=Rhizorhabdus histidinilytica TaxID=439228 RepID=UPI001ADAC37B|nr:hypothetical protein [Rhizorhabdus histidinilytica]MBO9380218.1 hypothetical protein [Rhizorhabdus histidinilytica]